MTSKMERQIKNKIRNNLQTYILTDMFEHTIYTDKNLTCEEVGEAYIKMMTELVNEYVAEQNLYLSYVNRNK